MLSRRSFIQNAFATVAIGSIALREAIAIQPTVFCGEDKLLRLVKTAGHQNWKQLSIGDLMGKIANHLEGTPYAAGTLELSADQEICSVNLNQLDCVTFVETTLALARMLKKGGHTKTDLLAEIQFIRYRGGSAGDYSTRLHYTSDWLADNEAKHVVRLLSQLPGAEVFLQKVNFMTSNPKYYKQLSAHADLIAKMKSHESAINQRTLKYIPLDKIAAVEPLLKTGDIVAICTSLPGLDITHTGLVWRDDRGVAHFMDASSRKNTMKVVLEPGPISRTLTQSGNHDASLIGVMFARPLEPL